MIIISIISCEMIFLHAILVTYNRRIKEINESLNVPRLDYMRELFRVASAVILCAATSESRARSRPIGDLNAKNPRRKLARRDHRVTRRMVISTLKARYFRSPSRNATRVSLVYLNARLIEYWTIEEGIEYGEKRINKCVHVAVE